MRQSIILLFLLIGVTSCDIPKVDTSKVKKEIYAKKVKHISEERIKAKAEEIAKACLDSVYNEAEKKLPNGVLGINDSSLATFKQIGWAKEYHKANIKLMSENSEVSYPFLKNILNQYFIEKNKNATIGVAQNKTVYIYSKPIVDSDNKTKVWLVLLPRKTMVDVM